MRTKGDRLTQPQAIRFCAEYVKNGRDAAAAAIAAGYTEQTAHVKRHQWLRDLRYIMEIDRMSKLMTSEIDAILDECKQKMAAVKPERPRPDGNAVPPPGKEKTPKLPKKTIPEDHKSDLDDELKAHARAVAEAAAKVRIDKEWVLRELVANHLRATSGEKLNLAASNKALELIGTELQMFVKREHLTFDTLQDLSPEQAAQELGKAFADAAHLSPDLVGLLAQFSGTRQ